MAQSVIQVAGRAGRESRAGEVLIQTAFPENEFWGTLIEGGYRQISERRPCRAGDHPLASFYPPRAVCGLPPTEHEDAHRFLEVARRHLAAETSQSLRVLGPVDAPMARKAGRYRAQLLLQSSDRSSLHRVLRELRQILENDASARKVRWSIDVDPCRAFLTSTNNPVELPARQTRPRSIHEALSRKPRK